MRVVAILDPEKTPEFTLGGTMFILVFIGVVFGSIFGAISGVLRRVLRKAPRALVALIPAGLAMALIVADSELISELVELGAGPVVNIPMFGGIAYLYGLVLVSIVDRLTLRRDRKMAALGSAELPA